MPRLVALLLLLAACTTGGSPDKSTDTDTDVVDTRGPPPDLVAGEAKAGAAEGTLKLPIGTPLGGFTARCGCLGGGLFKVDDRDSPYADAFIESAGVHIRPTIKAVWIENGSEHFVMTKTDTIYSFDGLVDRITQRLEELTGEDLKGKVNHAGNHNHSSYGNFSQHTGFFLGGDKFHRENFERFVEQVAQVAFEAYQSRRPAKLGFGNEKDWDPDNKVYSDRRGINNELIVFDDMGTEQGAKDPNLHLLRVDDAVTDEPIAVVFDFGMHPYVFSEDVQLATGDATTTIEEEVSEALGQPGKPVVAMFLQGSAGDASVRGSDGGWARMETVGAYARDAILKLREDTPAGGGPILLEASQKSVSTEREDIRVTRNGTVDWYFPEYDGDEDFVPDGEVFDANGDLISPLDEFHTNLGAVFCGSGDFDLPVGGFNTESSPYGTCMKVEFMLKLLEVFFDLSTEQVTPPIDGMTQTMVGGARIRGIPSRRSDGTVVEDADVVIGFVPGEPLHLYNEMWRHRLRDEMGIEDAMMVGYANDHYGYLLIMEDWVLGEYEADITFWGPIGGEDVLEGLLYDVVRDELMTDQKEYWDPKRGPFQYPDWPLENRVPDTTQESEVKLLAQGDIPTCDPADTTDPTRPCYAEAGAVEGLGFYVPEGFALDLDIPAELERLESIQVAWIGGDPGVDDVRITVEREVAPGTWEAMRSPSGKLISEDFADFGIAHTPTPLFPASVPQQHAYWATWQAVNHIHDRAGLPLGTYRLKLQGHRFAGGDTEFPWDSVPYELVTQTFEVVAAPIQLSKGTDGLNASLLAPSSNGFRMIDIAGNSRGHNPLRGEVTVTWNTTDGLVEDEPVEAPEPTSGKTFLAFPDGKTVTGARVVDAYGNEGIWGTMPEVEVK